MNEPVTFLDGRVQLYLGDCRDVLPTLASGSVDMVWTDPPYGHANHDGDWNARLNDHRGIENKPIANDSAEEMREVVDAALTEISRILKPDCCCCCCCGGGGGPRPTFAWVADRMDRGGLTFFHSVIWDKINPGLGWRYRRQHEMVMVSHREGGKLLWADAKKASPNIFSLMPPRERQHPNEKPLALVSHFLALHSTEGQTILDPFMGGGTTAIAAMRLNRRFIGVEWDPVHFATTIRRVEAEVASPTMFAEAPTKPVQPDMLTEAAE